MLTEIQLYNKRVAKHEKCMARKKPYGFVHVVAEPKLKPTITYIPQHQEKPKQTLWQRTKNFFGRIF